MSSVFDELMDEIGSPQLFAQLGRPVTHWPAGIAADATSVTAIFSPMTANEDASSGKVVKQLATLQVASSVEIDSRDIWLIDGVKYTAGEWTPLPGGMQQAMLKTPKQETTQPGRSGSF